MKKIFLFSGTSEGRTISEALSRALVYHTVFVATEYGKMVMQPSEYAKVEEGRLSFEDMVSLFEIEKPDLIVDATHPFATEVTENIRRACGDIEYLRVDDRYFGDDRTFCHQENFSVTDTQSAIEYLKSTSGNILLTTGVKTLPSYMAEDVIKDRIYARILPSMESLSMALETGIKPGHIIAQEGPFTVESNEALISQYDIKLLVTKNSGGRGGFIEKLTACENKGIEAVVINPQHNPKLENEGISVRDVIKRITGNDYKEKKVIIAGIGVGNLDSLTVATKSAIEKADLLVGAKRMVDFGKSINVKARLVCEYEAEKILVALEETDADNPIVLMSGDTGFHSGATKAKEVLEKAGYKVTVLPGISSVSYFASLIGWEYSDAEIISLHGNDISIENLIAKSDKFFAILSGPEDIYKLCDSIPDKWEVAVGYNLGYETQQVDVVKAANIKTGSVKAYTEKGLYIIAAKK